MMYAERVLAATALALSLAAAPVAAQEQPLATPDHSVTLFAAAGGFEALTNLDNTGTADFKKAGYALRAGGVVQLQRYVALRGNLAFARNELRIADVNTGTKLNRFFYDAAVQFQYPTNVGILPYVYLGGGAVTLHEVGTSGQNKTKATAAAGIGVGYTLPRSGFGLFLESDLWLWSAKDLSGTLSAYDKTQVETVGTVGVSYRLPF